MSDRVTIKIPRPLYNRIQTVLGEDSGFSSPTDFIVFVLRDLVGSMGVEAEGRVTPEVRQAIRDKLKNLGYL